MSVSDAILEDDLPYPGLFQAMGDRIMAAVREVKPLFLESLNKGLSLIGRDLCVCNTSFDTQWKEGSEGLYVMIHGLMGQPLIWNYHYEKLQELHPQAEIRAPAVPWAGNCSLEEAAKPFVDLVSDYAAKNPGKPICLIGFSNGARIASCVELALRGQETKILVSAVSGIYRGTRVIDLFVRSGLARFFLDKSVIEDLQYDSAASRALMKRINTEPLSTSAKRIYHFYTSRNDAAVVPYTGALPSVIYPASYTIVSGYGHNGLIEGICDTQVRRSLAFLLS